MHAWSMYRICTLVQRKGRSYLASLSRALQERSNRHRCLPTNRHQIHSSKPLSLIHICVMHALQVRRHLILSGNTSKELAHERSSTPEATEQDTCRRGDLVWSRRFRSSKSARSEQIRPCTSSTLPSASMTWTRPGSDAAIASKPLRRRARNASPADSMRSPVPSVDRPSTRLRATSGSRARSKVRSG